MNDDYNSNKRKPEKMSNSKISNFTTFIALFAFIYCFTFHKGIIINQIDIMYIVLILYAVYGEKCQEVFIFVGDVNRMTGGRNLQIMFIVTYLSYPSRV